MGPTSDLLTKAIGHVVRGETLIARQMETIAFLESKGHPTDLAYDLLDAMHVALDHMREDKAQIERLSGIKAEF
jgi:hypothetical protein